MEVLQGFDWWAVTIALVFIVFDFVSGIVKAAYNKSISSSVMRQGLYHKVAEFMVIVLAVFVDAACQHLELGFDAPILSVACAYIVLMEVASIIENIGEMNPDLTNSPVFGIFQKGESNDALRNRREQ
jgi:toxin secretion/phage lysis holin